MISSDWTAATRFSSRFLAASARIRPGRYDSRCNLRSFDAVCRLDELQCRHRHCFRKAPRDASEGDGDYGSDAHGIRAVRELTNLCPRVDESAALRPASWSNICERRLDLTS